MPKYEGVYRGRIVATSDPTASGRVQVNIPAMAGNASVWAPVCTPFGNLAGAPRVGATVWVAFEAGDSSYPVVLGTSP